MSEDFNVWLVQQPEGPGQMGITGATIKQGKRVCKTVSLALYGDPETGEVRKKFSVSRKPVGMVHDRCYRNKASANFIFTGKDGIEVIDLEKGWVGNNSWVRGTCQYGILPANGMLYAPPDACGCHRKARLQGLNALSSSLPESAKGKPVSETGRLVKGPAYGQVSAATPPDRAAWTMYRHDGLRSGATSASVPSAVTE